MENQHLLAEISAMIDRGDLIAACQQWDALERAGSSDPSWALVGSRLLSLRGRYAQAAGLLDQALAIHPQDTGVLVARGQLAARMSDDTGAEGWFRRAYDQTTGCQAWCVEWLDTLLRLGRLDEARAIATAHYRTGSEQAGFWFRLGLAYQHIRQFRPALEAYQVAYELQPTLPMLLNNMGAGYLELNEYVPAKAALESAIRQAPDNALAWTNLATLLLKTSHLQESLIAAERACTLAPNYVSALQTYSYVLREHQQWDDALAAARRALASDPTNASVIWTVAMLELMRGDYESGWRHHEGRWSGSPELRDIRPNLPVPAWNGEPLEGKTVMVWGEQGHGDVLQFVRFVPELAQRVQRAGGKLVYCCFESLLPLLRRSLEGVVETIVGHETRPLPDFHYHLPLCSIPLLLETRLDDLAKYDPYLVADAGKVATWSKRLPASGKLRVGLAWTGSRDHQRNPYRAISPAALAEALAPVDGIEFVCLQKDAEDDVEAARQAGLHMTDVTGGIESFDDTAALVRSLDLVITVCTSIAHLAGGLGVPTWVLLDVNPHWVWMTERCDSPWYPSVTLFRQREYRQWQPVLEAVRQQLREQVASHPSMVPLGA
jgi:tetratricopeptide (TPR) repeat protein